MYVLLFAMLVMQFATCVSVTQISHDTAWLHGYAEVTPVCPIGR